MKNFLGNHLRRKKIEQDAENKTLSHALLLCGPQGTEKFSFLTHLAHTLLKSTNPHPPELVIVDKLYTEGKDTDMAILSKLSTFDQSQRKKKKKRTDTIGVDDLEAFTKHLYETVNGEYKILLIRNVERMTRETANNFLKLLEEPPAKTLFLMTTSSESKVLPTLLSRTRREHFSLVPQEHIENFVDSEGEKFSTEEKKLLLEISHGRSALLKKMMNDSNFFAEEKEKKLTAENIPSLSDLEKMDIAELWAKKSVPEIQELLASMEGYLRSILRENISAHTSPNSNILALEKTQEAMIGLKKNGNKRMVLESVFLSL